MKLERPVFEVRPPVESLDICDLAGYRFYDPLNLVQRKERKKNGMRIKTTGVHRFFGTDMNKLDLKAKELIKRGFPCVWITLDPFVDDWTGLLTYSMRVADYDEKREDELGWDIDLQDNDTEEYRYCGFAFHKQPELFRE